MKPSEAWITPCLYLFLFQARFVFGHADDQEPLLPTMITTGVSPPSITAAPNEARLSVLATDAAPDQAPDILLSSIVTTTTTFYAETSHVVLATYGVYAANLTRTVPVNNRTIDVTIPLKSLPLRTVWVSHLTFVAGPRVDYVPTVGDITTTYQGEVQGIGFKAPTATPSGPTQLVKPFCRKDRAANLTLKMPHMVATGRPWIEKLTFQESYSGFYCHQSYTKHRINDCMNQFTTPLVGIKTLVDLPALRQTVLASTTVVVAPHWGVTRGQSKKAIKEDDCNDEESCLMHCELTSRWFKRPKFKLIVFGVPMVIMVILAFTFAHRLGRRGKSDKTAAADKEATPSSTDGIFRGRRGVSRTVEPPSAPPQQASAQNDARNRRRGESSIDEATSSDHAAAVDVGHSNQNPSTHSDKKVRDRYTTGSEAAENGDSHAFQRKKSEP